MIGAGALVTEANGLDLDRAHGVRDAMVELIKIVEGFYACGVAASVYAKQSDAGSVTPDPVFANIGKLLMATQIYDMHRLAHQVSGGMVVTLPGSCGGSQSRDRRTPVRSADCALGHSVRKRIEVARFLEDLTASHQAGWYSVISLHGGGSPEAMKTEIYRHYPIGSKVELVERLLDRGVLADETRKITRNRQPGRCCAVGCFAPDTPHMVPLTSLAKRLPAQDARARILLPPTEQAGLASRREAARRLDRATSLLLVVDIQERLASHVSGHEALIARTQALLGAAVRLDVPRLATEHCAGQIGPLVPAIAGLLEPRETFSKSHFGATDHPEFRALLARAARTQIVVAGMEAHVCVMQTALGLAGLHYDVFVVGDAVGSRAERQADREFALSRLRSAGCTIVGTETVLFEWTGSGDDAAFRDVLKIVKALPPT